MDIKDGQMIPVENKQSHPKIIFIVPYRDREQQLIFFKRHIQYVLEDMNKEDYEIMIIHQKDKRSFNCGALKNIGFLIKFLDLLVKKIIPMHLEYNGTILKKLS